MSLFCDQCGTALLEQIEMETIKGPIMRPSFGNEHPTEGGIAKEDWRRIIALAETDELNPLEVELLRCWRIIRRMELVFFSIGDRSGVHVGGIHDVTSMKTCIHIVDGFSTQIVNLKYKLDAREKQIKKLLDENHALKEQLKEKL
jgi:hypothetical protein